MKRYCALLFLLPTLAIAQGNDLFCNAGLRPDGFINFAALPAAPNFPTGGLSAPFTVTVPVTGVAGLTVQLTIPALQGNAGSPLYTVNLGTLHLGGFPAVSGTTSNGLLSLQFSNAVAGVGLIANNEARGLNYTLQTGLPGELPANFQNSATNNTEPLNFFSMPLVDVDLQNGFTTASVTTDGSGGGYGTSYFSNLRVQSMNAATAALNLVPRQGLQQWLQSEAGTPFAGPVSSWPDSSGNGHDATQTVVANQPGRVQGDGSACMGAFAFGGTSFFNFNLPIDGWSQMTVFLVAQSAVNPPASSGTSMASAIFWNENAEWGNTFVSPYQTTVPFRFGTTQVGNQPVYTRPLTVGQDFTITRTVHNNTTDSLYVNGLLALEQGSKSAVLKGTTGAAYIGRGLNNTYFVGEISEVLVYNRVLTDDESASVESYLRNKFATR